MTWLRAIPAFLVATALAACASSGSVAAPAAGPPATTDGRFVWQDLVTTDASAARRFYSGLLGWEFEETTRHGRPYLIARTSSGTVGGIVDIRDIKDAGSQWVSYVIVPDIDRSVQQVQAAGGKVLVPPSAAGIGRASVIVDPQGAALGLLKPSAPISAEPATPLTGHFFWREYLAQDTNKALEFYKSLLGYSTSSDDAQLGPDYFVLRRDRPRAGLHQIPGTVSNVRPNWLPYVLVDDPASLAPKVNGLGGRVLLTPGPNRRNGTLVIVADPTGGVVALQKYPM